MRIPSSVSGKISLGALTHRDGDKEFPTLSYGKRPARGQNLTVSMVSSKNLQPSSW